MVKMLVSHFFPQVSFSAVMGASEDLPRKPDPAGAFFIAKKLSISPEKFIFLGDSKTDMETATAAGMFAVGALWGFRDAGELLAFGAKRLVKRPEELLFLVEK
jgi:phosphoglycolate phosphatase